MGKNGHQAKAIATAKWTVWVKKKLLKTCEKRLLNHILFDQYKKRMEKTANIRETRGF